MQCKETFEQVRPNVGTGIFLATFVHTTVIATLQMSVGLLRNFSLESSM